MKTMLLLLLSIHILLPGFSQTLQPNADAARAGFAEERLKRIDAAMAEWVSRGLMQGGVGMIVKDGKIIYHKAVGFNDADAKSAMPKDGIFRIASQTKAITSVAMMMLYEEGKLLLDDPVSKYIPAFKNQVVLEKFNAADTTYTTVPAKSAVTIRQLLSHTSGIGYAQIGSEEARAIYARSKLTAGLGVRNDNLLEAMNRLGALPLMHQPGAKWTYGLNNDLVGALIEVISGMSLDKFFRSRIFEPLGMKDTYFNLPKEKANRLVTLYSHENGRLNKAKSRILNDVTVTPNYPLEATNYFSGGAGLSSTLIDYAVFLQMLLNEGKYNGVQILAPGTVRMMITNQIGNLPFGKEKFGLGFSLVTEESRGESPASVGTFAWAGAFATSYWVDPKEKLIIQFYRQIMDSPSWGLAENFKVMAYAALVE